MTERPRFRIGLARMSAALAVAMALGNAQILGRAPDPVQVPSEAKPQPRKSKTRIRAVKPNRKVRLMIRRAERNKFKGNKVLSVLAKGKHGHAIYG